MTQLTINETKELDVIAPEIYGHFSEHLGRCIYEGLYVGEDSDIPNVNGMRTDVVEALKEMGIPLLHGPDRAVAAAHKTCTGCVPVAFFTDAGPLPDKLFTRPLPFGEKAVELIRIGPDVLRDRSYDIAHPAEPVLMPVYMSHILLITVRSKRLHRACG